MDGKSLKCGAVAGLRIVKNPISLARLVMQETPHVLLAGDGAEVFATQMQKKFSQIEIVENSYFSTDEQYEEWQRKRAKQDQPIQESGGKKGTVGCVVLDTHGDIVAGTSTGGLTNKKFGRVGDSPIIGAGTYANNKTCGVSCTGTGEYFIRHSIAFQINALMDFKQASLDEAVRHVIFNVLPDDIGGLIAIDHQGNISMHTNTPGMSRGAADSSGRFEVKIARDP